MLQAKLTTSDKRSMNTRRAPTEAEQKAYHALAHIGLRVRFGKGVGQADYTNAMKALDAVHELVDDPSLPALHMEALAERVESFWSNLQASAIYEAVCLLDMMFSFVVGYHALAAEFSLSEKRAIGVKLWERFSAISEECKPRIILIGGLLPPMRHDVLGKIVKNIPQHLRTPSSDQWWLSVVEKATVGDSSERTVN